MNTKTIMMLLAFLVIVAFSSVGIAIGLRNYWLAGFLFILGFIIMGFGLRLKRRTEN
jgi:hypothetical protein